MIEGQEGVSWLQWKALARACEKNGISTLFRSDHYMNLDGRHPERGSLDAWGRLNALAAVTTRLRLGTMVSPVTFRHPSELAKLVATADRISDGGSSSDWVPAGTSASMRRSAFPSRTHGPVWTCSRSSCRWCWGTGQRVRSFVGKHYQLRDLSAEPKPVQRPHPPLIMGGSAGPRSCALAARFADEYNTVYATVTDVLERRRRVVEACERVGREPIPFSIMTAVVAGTDEADLRGRLGRIAQARGQAPDAWLAEPPRGWVIGTVEQVA